jgi:hypothetical protein
MKGLNSADWLHDLVVDVVHASREETMLNGSTTFEHTALYKKPGVKPSERVREPR